MQSLNYWTLEIAFFFKVNSFGDRIYRPGDPFSWWSFSWLMIKSLSKFVPDICQTNFVNLDAANWFQSEF